MAKTPETPDQGKPDAEKASVEAEDATAAVSQEKADAKAADAPKPAKKKKPADKNQAEGTAAKKTGVDKVAAESVEAGDAAPKKAAAKPAAAKKAAAKPAAAKKADAKPAAAKKGDAKPAKPKKVADAPAARPAARRRDRREVDATVVVRAHAKYVRSSARKARLVCNQIRGKSVPEARALLAFSPRDVAEAWTKLLDSAVANAEHNHDLVGDDLKVLAVFADEGPTIKRFRPRAMGRATSIRKRTSHLTIQLTPKEL